MERVVEMHHNRKSSNRRASGSCHEIVKNCSSQLIKTLFGAIFRRDVTSTVFTQVSGSRHGCIRRIRRLFQATGRNRLLVRDRRLLIRQRRAPTAPRRSIQLIAMLPRIGAFPSQAPIAKATPRPPAIKARMVSKVSSLCLIPFALRMAAATITRNPKIWVECGFIASSR